MGGCLGSGTAVPGSRLHGHVRPVAATGVMYQGGVRGCLYSVVLSILSSVVCRYRWTGAGTGTGSGSHQFTGSRLECLWSGARSRVGCACVSHASRCGRDLARK